MNGCRRALRRSRSSIQAATARWKSVNSWSNRFVSLAVLALAAGCHSTPRQPAPRAPQPAAPAPAPSSAPVPATAPAAAASSAGAPRPGPGAAAAAPAAVEAPVPERAAQQYAQALNMMRSGRGTDAELELKQLALSYPQYSGPEVNLGLLY